jgi:hypothetical protein
VRAWWTLSAPWLLLAALVALCTVSFTIVVTTGNYGLAGLIDAPGPVLGAGFGITFRRRRDFLRGGRIV